MIREEAIMLLDEICKVAPELIERATEISLDDSDKKNCKIIIRDNFTLTQRNFLLNHFVDRKIQVIERSTGVWVIY